MTPVLNALRSLFLVVAAACASSGGVPAGFSPQTVPGSFALDALPGEEDFVVPVTVNGAGPLPFLLDTGATSSAIYPRGMRAGGLLPSPDASVVVRGLTKAEEAPLVEVARLGLGPAAKEDLLLPALPAPSFGDIAGVLGLDVLRDYALVWNAEARRMIFVPADSFDASAFENWDKVPLQERPYGGPVYGIVFGTAVLGGTSVPVLIDTGTAPSVINWEAAAFSRAVRQLRSRLREKWEVEGASGRFTPKAIATLPTVKLGEHDWEMPRMLILDLAPLDVLGAGGKPLMIAGADMLSGRSFAVDFEGGLLLIGPALRTGFAEDSIAPRGIAADALSRE